MSFFPEQYHTRIHVHPKCSGMISSDTLNETYNPKLFQQMVEYYWENHNWNKYELLRIRVCFNCFFHAPKDGEDWK